MVWKSFKMLWDTVSLDSFCSFSGLRIKSNGCPWHSCLSALAGASYFRCVEVLNSCQVFSQWQLKLHVFLQIKVELFSWWECLNTDRRVQLQTLILFGIKKLWLYICLFMLAGLGQYEPDWCPVSMPTEASGRGKPKPSCQKVTSLPQSKLYRVSDQNYCPYPLLLKCSFYSFLFLFSSLLQLIHLSWNCKNGRENEFDRE